MSTKEIKQYFESTKIVKCNQIWFSRLANSVANEWQLTVVVALVQISHSYARITLQFMPLILKKHLYRFATSGLKTMRVYLKTTCGVYFIS